MPRWPDVSMSDRFWIKVDISSAEDCWEWMARKDGHGYGRFTVNATERLCAHRVAYELWFGPIKHGYYICHKCDNPGCVNPAHLFQGTALDNMRDCVNKNRQAREFKMPHTKVSDEQVRNIRSRIKAGERQVDLAREYGVSADHIYAINKRKFREKVLG